jgi:hypothetical protein
METREGPVQESRPLPIRAGLSYRDFVAEYLYPNLPVILADGVAQWNAVGKWTPEFFRQSHATKTIVINDKSYSPSQFIDLVEQSDLTRPAPYLRNEQVRTVFPELRGVPHAASPIHPSQLAKGPLLSFGSGALRLWSHDRSDSRNVRDECCYDAQFGHRGRRPIMLLYMRVVG